MIDQHIKTVRGAFTKLAEHDQRCGVFDLDDEGKHRECTCGLNAALVALAAIEQAHPDEGWEIDYHKLIADAFANHKYAQGTRECVAFKYGAEWAMHNYWPTIKQAQAEAVPQDVDWPDIEDMAHSALQEALSFGVNHDAFHRFGKLVMQKTRDALAAAPQPKQAEAVPPTHVMVPVEPTEAMLYPVKEDPPGSVLGDMGAKYRKVVWSSMLDASMKQGDGV